MRGRDCLKGPPRESAVWGDDQVFHVSSLRLKLDSDFNLKPKLWRDHHGASALTGGLVSAAGNRPRATHTWDPASYPQGTGALRASDMSVRPETEAASTVGHWAAQATQVRGELKGVIAAKAERSGMTAGQALLHWVELGKGP